MRNRRLSARLLTSFALFAAMTGCASGTAANRLARAGDTPVVAEAVKAAKAARRALASKQPVVAVAEAETAVAAAPRDAGFRVLLGDAYQAAGRFAAASMAYADALTLTPDDGRVALKLALAELALGKNEAARNTLADYADRIPASDYGLAVALAGDREEGMRVLETAARADGATARTRQNLALVYALAGDWRAANVTAAQDLSPQDAAARVVGWSAFSNQVPAEQVASLLGVQPVQDSGRPERLAATGVAEVVLNDPKPVDAPAAEEPSAAVAAAPVSEAAPAPVVVAIPTGDAPAAVQVALPAPVRASYAPARSVAPMPVTKGRFVVQLGAYDNAGVSRDAWGRLVRRYALGRYVPANATVRVRGITMVRLSFGGFANHASAAKACATVRARGGKCFVRANDGDRTARWVNPRIRVASIG